MFIGIVQISRLATACIGPPLILEPYWKKLDVCPDSCCIKDKLCLLHLYAAHDKGL